MNSIQSYADYNSLLKIINAVYAVDVHEIYLHRDMIGYVYFANSRTKRYVLKLYRCFDAENALRSIQIIQLLRKNDFPVVSIVPTTAGDRYATIDTPQGPSIAILFDFEEGGEPTFANDMVNIGRYVGRLHRIMNDCQEPLISRGKDFYIDRYIEILRVLEYDPGRIDELECYGTELWNSMERLPHGFCHGDLHSGNMVQTVENQYVLFDFDVASRTYGVIDVATVCNAADFNRFDEAAYDQTLRVFERFYKGYREESEISDLAIAAIFDFTAIRHYEIIATITRCQGLEELTIGFLDEQYEWLMRWKNVCDRKRR